MDTEIFRERARFFVGLNLTENVARVIASFDEQAGHLKVFYCLHGEPTDDDEEECELTCGELIAAFPEIRTAETDFHSLRDCAHSQLEIEAQVYPEI